MSVLLDMAARACKERFPRCGGMMVWMGHDAFACPANTSILDFEGEAKPAYFALQEVLRGRTGTTVKAGGGKAAEVGGGGQRRKQGAASSV